MPAGQLQRWFAACSLLISLGVVTVAPSLADDDREQALRQVRDKIERLRSDIEKTQTLHDSVRTELAKIEKDINQLHRTLKQLDKNLTKQNRKLNTLYAKRKTLRKDVKTQQQLLEKQILAAYMIGRQEYVKLILNQEDPAVIGRTMAYYNYFNRARVERIDGSRQSLKALIDTEKQIKAETSSWRRNRAWKRHRVHARWWWPSCKMS